MCKPFLLQVGMFAPEAGYKFDVLVERACTAQNDSIWRLVFDLFKRSAQGAFDPVVHVSFRGGSDQEGDKNQADVSG